MDDKAIAKLCLELGEALGASLRKIVGRELNGALMDAESVPHEVELLACHFEELGRGATSGAFLRGVSSGIQKRPTIDIP